MSLFQRNSAKYILLKNIKFSWGKGSDSFRRGEICEELNHHGLLVPSGYVALCRLGDQIFGLRFLCPNKDAARLIGTEDENLMMIHDLEDRYRLFKRGSRLTEPGSKVFVTVNDREIPGVVTAVHSPFGLHSETILKVEVQEHIIRAKGLQLTSSDGMEYDLEPNGNITVLSSLDKSRPRYETDEVPGWWNSWPWYQANYPGGFISSSGNQTWPVGIIEESGNNWSVSWSRDPNRRDHELRLGQWMKEEFVELNSSKPFEQKTKKFAKQRFRPSEQRVQELENTLAEERRAHEQTKESLNKRSKMLNELVANLSCTHKALEGKEKEAISIKQELDALERKLTEKQGSKEVEKQEEKTTDELYEIQGKLAFEQKAKEKAENHLQCSEEEKIKIIEVETALAVEQKLAAERRAHEQTKESLKERSIKLNELEVNLAWTQKALKEKENEVISIKQELGASERKLTEEQASKEVLEKQKEKTADELYEIQGKLASEQKAKEEVEKRLKELETTLAEVQKLVKRKQKPDNECEWILNRKDIHLTNEELGSGAFGTVYKGTFRGTPVAIKQVSVKPIITEYNEENFKREMKMAARCRHPCMLQFIGATSDDQSPLLMTELLDTSLKLILRERPLDPIETKTISMDVAKGLNYLHLNQPHPIVHRDISSGNVLLWKHGQSWRGKISDYGNAVLMNYARTGSGGALPYLAPEMNNQKFSTKSDVYSYGVLLLEMCRRKEPSCLDDKDELICLVEDGEMRNLIRKCLRQNPTQRPSMEEVLAALESISELTGNRQG